MTVEAIDTVHKLHRTENRLPNNASFLVRWFQRLLHTHAIRRQQRIDRAAFSNLLSLDERTLQDMGVTRDDVIWASKLPIASNAALELQVIKEKRKTPTNQ